MVSALNLPVANTIFREHPFQPILGAILTMPPVFSSSRHMLCRQIQYPMLVEYLSNSPAPFKRSSRTAGFKWSEGPSSV